MPLETEPDKQFNVLIAGSLAVNHRRHIIEANAYDDILTLIETTQFHLILLDSTENYSSVITRIRDPLGMNNGTPVIAIVNSTEEIEQFEADAWLVKPISEQLLDETIDAWQTKAIAQAYIQILLDKTKNNQGLTLIIFEKLFEELPDQIAQIEEALKNDQYDRAREITHKLNGSVSFCGLATIQQSANSLERCLLDKTYASINRDFQTLRQCTLSFTGHQETIMKLLQ
jgi:HPt (histidine-containing phosphotransfer) domain-containing protein